MHRPFECSEKKQNVHSFVFLHWPTTQTRFCCCFVKQPLSLIRKRKKNFWRNIHRISLKETTTIAGEQRDDFNGKEERKKVSSEFSRLTRVFFRWLTPHRILHLKTKTSFAKRVLNQNYLITVWPRLFFLMIMLRFHDLRKAKLFTDKLRKQHESW